MTVTNSFLKRHINILELDYKMRQFTALILGLFFIQLASAQMDKDIDLLVIEQVEAVDKLFG